MPSSTRESATGWRNVRPRRPSGEPTWWSRTSRSCSRTGCRAFSRQLCWRMRARRPSWTGWSSNAAFPWSARARFWPRRCRSTKSEDWRTMSSRTTARSTRPVARSGRCGLASDLSEDLFRVLAELRRAALGQAFEHTARRDLRVRTDLVEVEHRLAARIDHRQDLLPLVASARHEDPLDLFLRGHFLRVLPVDKVRPPERVAQRRPELRLQRTDAVMAPVFALIHAVARVAPGEPLVATGHAFARGPRRKTEREPADCTICHGDVEVATFASALDADQGAQDLDRRAHATATDVRDLHR